jgi:hypothetical protein
MRNICLDVPGLRGNWSFDGRFTGQFGTAFRGHSGLPNPDVTSGQFGQIASLSGDARVMQFALKLYYQQYYPRIFPAFTPSWIRKNPRAISPPFR